MLEALSYQDNAFVTLTYDEDCLPKINGVPTLLPEELKNFLKHLRVNYQRYQEKLHKELKINEPIEEWAKRFRFYAVGEYGGKFGRPHYHVILFNFPGCSRGRTRRAHRTGAADWNGCCTICTMVGKTWGRGIVEVGTVERGSAEYVCEGYITKNMRRNDDGRLLKGQHPEFSRMSRMPGVGQPSLWEYADALLSHDLQRMSDVPRGVAIGKTTRGIGRYLRHSLRAFIGNDPKTPKATLDAIKEEMRPLREVAFDNSISLKEAITTAFEGRRTQMMRRKALFGRKKVL